MSRRVIRGIFVRLFLLRVRLAHSVFGIDAVSRAVSRAPRFLIPILLTRYGATVGAGLSVKDGILIDNADGDEDARGDFGNLAIGARCYVGKGAFFDLPDRIVLEDEVIVSAGVRILTHADCGERALSRWFPRKRAPVRVGRGTWLGVGAVVLAGVELGECCVVAAGAVVTKSFPARSVVAGVPAKLSRTLPD